MKKITTLFVALLAVAIVFAQKTIPKPVPERLVVDNAQILSAEQQAALENRLVALDDSTSNQIAIVTVQSLNGESIEDVAVNTFRSWGIGDKKTKNGVLVLVAVAERKVRIEVGYGLEGAIPDITANTIIENDIKPNFKVGDYYQGLDNAITNIAKAAVGEYKVAKQPKANKNSGGGGLFIIILIVVIVILFAGRGNGGRGGGGGLTNALLLASLLNDGGGRRSSGWGGDSGGGGFGGFGGGSSGGGGASGSW